MKCEFCHGKGHSWGLVKGSDGRWGELLQDLPCRHCHGVGIVSCCEGAERCSNPTPDEELDDAAR